MTSGIGTGPTRPARYEPVSDTLYGPDLPAGSSAGPYLIEHRAARGGFATVYRGVDQGGSPVAVKVLHQLLIHTPKLLQRFDQEVALMRRVHHAGIVEVLATGALPDGRPYYVMPWLGDRTLDHELAARGSFAPADAVAVVLRVCDALAAAHAVAVIHRDVKPSNVLLIGDRIMLVDFGVAKALAEDAGGRSGLTSTGVLVGTPHYMAPEQITGEPVDARTDVYAVGVMLFQLVTGRLPFEAATPVEVEALHLDAAPPSAAEIAPVGRALDRVIHRCLAKAAEQRYASADKLAEALAVASRPAVAGTACAVGVHIELRLAPSDVTDTALDALERTVDLVRARCVEREWGIAVDGGVSVLVARSSEDADVESGLRLGREVIALVAPPVDACITVHMAEVVTRGGVHESGPLLALLAWIAPSDASGVHVTASAGQGMDDAVLRNYSATRL